MSNWAGKLSKFKNSHAQTKFTGSYKNCAVGLMGNLHNDFL